MAVYHAVSPDWLRYNYSYVTTENRKFLLNRSIFDLVDAHKYLSLTDPKLLGWYLCLSPEDRNIIQDEGGFHYFLQRHPALELSPHHVYVKYGIACVLPVQSTMTSSRPAHVSRSSSGASWGRSEMSDTRLDMDMMPSTVRETLNFLDCTSSGDGSQKPLTAFSSPTREEPKHQKVHQTRSLAPLNQQSPSHQMSSWSPAVCSQTAVTPGQRTNYTSTGVGPSQSDWPTVYKDSSPESYGSVLQPGELRQVGRPLDPVEETGCQDHVVSDDEFTVRGDEVSDIFHSIMETDESILVCLTSEDVKAQITEVPSDPVITGSEALTADSETFKPAQSVAKITTEEPAPPRPRLTTRDMAVGTEPPPSTSAATQTETPETADEHVLTEVHMSDLDYLADEFIKLKKSQEELREMKMKSSACKPRAECECGERAQRAELDLLDLQHLMCRQHCWRLYWSSAGGGRVRPQLKEPPANITSVLQKLDWDYNEMRTSILAGVPLEQLQPLSVETETITSGARYTPAQLVGDVLGNPPSCSSKEPQKHPASAEGRGRPDDPSRTGGQLSQRKEKPMMMESSKPRRAVTLLHHLHQTEDKTKAAGQEVNTSESWYDAEEDLRPAETGDLRPAETGDLRPAETGEDLRPAETGEDLRPAETGDLRPDETGEDPTVTSTDKSDESGSHEVKRSDKPSHVTESEVMLWLEKHQRSEVNGSASNKDFSNRAIGQTQNWSQSQSRIKIQIQNQSQAPASIRDPGSPEGQSPPPLSSSIQTRKTVSTRPTARGTFVPQHYGTMGSFDRLMAELTQLHPNVDRQRMVEALMELQAQHRGVLCGLPLRTIRDMTSQLLTRPTRDMTSQLLTRPASASQS